VLLLGKNNSGKSTVGKLIHHVLLALSSNSQDPFPMQSEEMSYGASFRDIQHNGNFFSPLDLSMELELEDGLAAKLDIQLNQLGDLSADALPVLEKLELDGQDVLVENAQMIGILPKIQKISQWRDEAAQLLSASCRIQPLRDSILSSYSVDKVASLGVKPSKNEQVAQLLLNDIELRTAVSAWMAENLEGWRIDVKQSLDVFHLIVRRGGREINLANAGQGLQQVLPVITLCCWRQLGRGQIPFLDVVEQPELHLHDAAHAPLGDLLLAAVAQGKGSMVVETHSEALILRVRRRIAEGLDPRFVSLVYVEDLGEGSRLKQIPVSADGSVDWWPDGVFSESFVEIKAIRQAQRKRQE
jgi:hypothetical protein